MATTDLDRFLRTDVYRPADGRCVPFAAFVRRFNEWLSEQCRPTWTAEQVKPALRSFYPVGRGPRNVLCVGNLTDDEHPYRRYALTGEGELRLSPVAAD